MEKKILLISSLFLLALTMPVMAIQNSPEITISTKNITKLPLWYRIKHTIEQRLESTFKIQKKLKDLIKHGNVVVKFYRPGCRYCVYIDPILDTIKNKFAHNVTFISVNLNEQTENYKATYDFEYVPTIVYFKDGKEVLRHGSESGTITAQEIKKNIRSAFQI
jgi:thiol-disulfide isomerase/thioredoxin